MEVVAHAVIELVRNGDGIIDGVSVVVRLAVTEVELAIILNDAVIEQVSDTVADVVSETVRVTVMVSLDVGDKQDETDAVYDTVGQELELILAVNDGAIEDVKTVSGEDNEGVSVCVTVGVELVVGEQEEVTVADSHSLGEELAVGLSVNDGVIDAVTVAFADDEGEIVALTVIVELEVGYMDDEVEDVAEIVGDVLAWRPSTYVVPGNVLGTQIDNVIATSF